MALFHTSAPLSAIAAVRLAAMALFGLALFELSFYQVSQYAALRLRLEPVGLHSGALDL